MTTLVIAEHDNAHLKEATLNTVAAATCLNADIHLLVAGYGAHAVAHQAAGMTGVTQVWWADAPHLAHSLAENLAAQVLTIARGYSHILFAATASGKNVAPRVAAKLDVAQVSDIIAIATPDTFHRPIYAGNAIATQQSSDDVKVLTVRSTSFNPVSVQPDAAAPIVKLPPVANHGRVTFIGREQFHHDRPDLASAHIVVAGGRGLGSTENFALIHQLADKLGAAVGASRAAVDAGYAPNDWQIGQSGSVVAPQLYIAVGISGALQHLAGMKDSKIIVAINQDSEAPIFNVADFGLVGDLFQIVPELINAL
jgi:electron transfer flavoprotein alpha subunit